ncbi:MAG TPA: methyltransferase domain-containing protein [Bacteroidia bacterium]|nr:methyltransferase domain-containing protein [Bacteroidia bacterium]
MNSELLFRKYSLNYFKDNMKVLEIGPVGYPSYYSKVVDKKSLDWHTLDIGIEYIEKAEANRNHIKSESEYNYPIPDNTYDIVLSGQVMEHVKDIWQWMTELKRITKIGGHIIIVCPVSWPYHEAPVDCWRIYPEGMKALMEKVKLEIKKCVFESLELDLLPRNVPTFPGVSTIPLNGKLFKTLKLKIIYNQIILRIPFIRRFSSPISVAYDTICISEKIQG